MNDAEDDILAALWAAGALPAPECRAARERARLDPAFAAKVGEWEDGLAPLALAPPPLAPPSGALAKIEARLDARARFEKLAKTLRASPQGPWIIVAPGVRYRCSKASRTGAPDRSARRPAGRGPSRPRP